MSVAGDLSYTLVIIFTWEGIAMDGPVIQSPDLRHIIFLFLLTSMGLIRQQLIHVCGVTPSAASTMALRLMKGSAAEGIANVTIVVL